MISRILFLLIAAFWTAMNVLLWRAEYGGRGSGISVPVDLVWRKILTAPDASSLTVYQNGEKTGFCEFATSIEQAMAGLDEDRPPPEGIIKQAGYQIRFDGNVSVGDFTNRLTFNGRIQFSSSRVWRELNLKLTSHADAVEIYSVATNQTIHLKVTSDGTAIDTRSPSPICKIPTRCCGRLPGMVRPPAGRTGFVSRFANLPLPDRRSSMGGAPRPFAGWPRPVSAYRLETRILDRPCHLCQHLGEILRVELPGGTTALLDQLGI